MSAILLVETLPRLIVQQAKRSNGCVINNNRRACVKAQMWRPGNGCIVGKAGIAASIHNHKYASAQYCMGAKSIRAWGLTYIQAVFCFVPSPIAVNERNKRKFRREKVGCQGCQVIEIWAGLGIQNVQVLQHLDAVIFLNWYCCSLHINFPEFVP